MFNVIFVILHYQNIDDTINCINSIKKLQGLDSNYKIILVDNKSPNNTGKELEKKYINDSNIETVLLEKNYGFSKANNIAFKKAKEYNPEIVLVLNNDIIFEDNNFLLNLSKICKNSKKYDIICPDIINLKDEHQNPMKEKEMNIGKAYKNMLYEFLFYLLMNVYGIRNIVANRRKKREEKWFENYYKETLKNKICLDNFIPFGAFIIYTNQWIKNEERAFVSDTFMYMEEDMLGIYIKQKKYRMLYSEGLKVRHLEGRSTQNTNENQYKVLKFKSINKAKALYKYIMFCEKMKKGKNVKMQEIIMKFILIILAILGIYLFYLKKNKYELILNGRFWIFVSWMTIFILYFFSGIKYKFNLNLYSFGYIILCLAIFFVGQYIVKKNVKENKIDKDEKNKIEVFRKTNFLPLFVIAFISVIIYTIYIIKINNIKIGVTRNINTNGIATILLLFSNSSLVIWLYELAYAILSEKKMTWYGLMSGVIYNIPGIVISGRDALMIFFVSTVIVLFYCGNYGKKVLGLEGKMYKKILRFLGVCLLLMMFYLIFLSNSRYGSTQEATIQMFKWSTDCQFPEYLENIYYKGGKVGSLILNIVFYYSSQLSKFSLIFENYNGPYLFGFYQLHYISRLLPDFMGMNFTNVTNAIQQIATNAGTPGIKVFWETAIGYSIYDFGKIGTLFISLIGGMLVEKINTLGKQKEGIISILIRAFICIAMFLTVEVSPLFDYYYIFPLFWLIIIVLFEKRRKSS